VSVVPALASLPETGLLRQATELGSDGTLYVADSLNNAPLAGALLLCYRKPSAKAPVIHPGDEAPFLVWGGEGSALRAAMRRLTEAGKPAMLGIDVLAQDKA
jgi:hypothetical protein